METLQIILDLCIPEFPNSRIPKFHFYISKFIHDILSGNTRSQKEFWKPDLNLGSQGCHHEKIINFTPWIWTRDPLHHERVFCYWTIKAVDIKYSVDRTNLPNQQKWPARMAIILEISNSLFRSILFPNSN
jgi:hypothetical protein